jgi:hypothetical protein
MTMALLGLVAGFMLVLVILLLVLLKSDVNPVWKFLLVLLAGGFYVLQYESLQQYMGWPTDDALPEKFVLIATDVREPDRKTGDTGVMYWWLRDSADSDQPPRVYRLPYRAELHEKSQQVLQQQQAGSQYVATTTGRSAESAGLGVSFRKISKARRHKKNNQ